MMIGIPSQNKPVPPNSFSLTRFPSILISSATFHFPSSVSRSLPKSCRIFRLQQSSKASTSSLLTGSTASAASPLRESRSSAIRSAGSRKRRKSTSNRAVLVWFRVDCRRAGRSARGLRVPARASADDDRGRAERQCVDSHSTRLGPAAALRAGKSHGGGDAGGLRRRGRSGAADGSRGGVGRLLCGIVAAGRSDVSVPSGDGERG